MRIYTIQCNDCGKVWDVEGGHKNVADCKCPKCETYDVRIVSIINKEIENV